MTMKESTKYSVLAVVTMIIGFLSCVVAQRIGSEWHPRMAARLSLATMVVACIGVYAWPLKPKCTMPYAGWDKVAYVVWTRLIWILLLSPVGVEVYRTIVLHSPLRQVWEMMKVMALFGVLALFFGAVAGVLFVLASEWREMERPGTPQTDIPPTWPSLFL